MAFNYDGFSQFKPDAGNIATSDGNAQQVTFIATVAAAVAYSAISWTVTESDDGITYVPVADLTSVITSKPADLTKMAKAFHCSYVGKRLYAQAVMTGGASPSYAVLYGMLQSQPVFAEGIRGVEDGNWTTNPPS